MKFIHTWTDSFETISVEYHFCSTLVFFLGSMHEGGPIKHVQWKSYLKSVCPSGNQLISIRLSTGKILHCKENFTFVTRMSNAKGYSHMVEIDNPRIFFWLSHQCRTDWNVGRQI